MSVGPVYRGGMDLSIRGSSEVQLRVLHTAQPGTSTVRGPTIVGDFPLAFDDPTAFADRTFTDGFVFRDPNTESGDGLTWYWGYDQPSQYDAGADTLSFHAPAVATGYDETSTRTSLETLRNDPISIDDNLDAWGLGLTMGLELMHRAPLAVTLQGGLTGFWGLDHDSAVSTYRERVTVEKWKTSSETRGNATYVYDLPEDPFTAEHVVPPDAPYEGTFDGPGPLIPNLPSSTEVTSGDTAVSRRKLSTSSYTAWNEVDFNVDADLYEIWAGPRVEFRTERLAFFVRPLLSLNLLDMDARRSEMWRTEAEMLQSWSSRANEQEWLWGGGVHGGVDVGLSENWSAAAYGGYDWVQQASVALGPNQVELDPSGYTVGFEIRKRFGNVLNVRTAMKPEENVK